MFDSKMAKIKLVPDRSKEIKDHSINSLQEAANSLESRSVESDDSPFGSPGSPKQVSFKPN